MHASLLKMPSSICVSLFSNGKQEGTSATLMFQGLHHRLKAYITYRQLYRVDRSHKGRMFLYCVRNLVSKTGSTAIPRYFLILWFSLASKIKPEEKEEQFMLIDDIYLILKCSYHQNRADSFHSIGLNMNTNLKIFEVEVKRFSLVIQIIY